MSNEVIMESDRAVEIFEPDLMKFDVETIVAQAEKQIEAMDRILTVAIKATNPNDWVNQAGKPYMRESGANKVCRVFGLNVSDVKKEKEFSTDDLGQYYFYTMRGRFSWKLGSIEAIGTTSSRDKFFGFKDGQFLPLSQVDETNLLKAAYANLLVNGITRLLGLRNLSWEQLKKAGLSVDSITKVEYKNEMKSSEDSAESQKLLREGLLKLTGNDETRAKEVLKTLTAFTAKDGKDVPGVELPSQLSGKRLQYTLEKVQKELAGKGKS